MAEMMAAAVPSWDGPDEGSSGVAAALAAAPVGVLAAVAPRA